MIRFAAYLSCTCALFAGCGSGSPVPNSPAPKPSVRNDGMPPTDTVNPFSGEDEPLPALPSGIRLVVDVRPSSASTREQITIVEKLELPPDLDRDLLKIRGWSHSVSKFDSDGFYVFAMPEDVKGMQPFSSSGWSTPISLPNNVIETQVSFPKAGRYKIEVGWFLELNNKALPVKSQPVFINVDAGRGS